MTINQLILSFKQKLDKIDSSAYPDILNEECRFWLDEGADRFVKQRYERNNLKRKGFEETQKRTDDLRATIRTEDIASIASTIYPDAFEVVLPTTGGAGSNRYRYLLKVLADVQAPDCNEVIQNNWVAPYQAQHDDVNVMQDDPFNKSGEDRPLFIIEGNNLVFFTDGTFSIPQAKVTYIRLFDKMQPNLPTSATYANGTTEYTELAEDTHEEVVDIAVKMALENIESQRYQTNIAEIREQE
jgi:hypothetical protein